MPVYEFYCQDCNNRYEEFHEMGCYDSLCPVCKKPARHILSPVYSNFSVWSDTVDKLGKWSTQHEDFSKP